MREEKPGAREWDVGEKESGERELGEVREKKLGQKEPIGGPRHRNKGIQQICSDHHRCFCHCGQCLWDHLHHPANLGCIRRIPSKSCKLLEEVLDGCRG